MTKRQQLAVVVPVHNESANLPLLYKALDKATKGIPYPFQFIFVDDGSQDDSLVVLETLALRDSRIRILEFARNFGKEAAVSAGLHHVRGQAAIILDADLQHPPEIIPQFVHEWEKGADAVIGRRAYHKTENPFKRFTSWLFYKLMAANSLAVVPNASDFRLLSRPVIDAFNKMTERNRMTRSLLDWLGFRQVYVEFETRPRANGDASYGWKQLVKLALDSFTAHSLLPLKFAGYLGVFILVVAGLLGIFMYVEKYVLGDPYNLRFTGTAMLATLIVFLVGLVLACLGLVAMYIARIHIEVSNRPLYVVRRDSVRQMPEESGDT